MLSVATIIQNYQSHFHTPHLCQWAFFFNKLYLSFDEFNPKITGLHTCFGENVPEQLRLC